MRLFPRFLASLLLCFFSVNSIYVFGQKPLSKPPRPVRSTPAPSRPQRSLRLTVTGTLDGHSYVDLGLSVKWATCNVGADSPEKYGDYFAWGETATKSSYTYENSKTYGVKLGDISGNVQYDAARSNWGGGWRLPTRVELKELVDICTSTWTTYKGVKGRLVKSKKNGNSIFLPAAGYWDRTSLYGASNFGCYWSSTPYEGLVGYAYDLYFGSGFFDWSDRWFCGNGLSVRPVHD